MLYMAYQTQVDVMAPLKAMAQAALGGVDSPFASFLPRGLVPTPVTAVWEMLGRSGLTHTRPAYDIKSVTIGNRDVPIVEEAVAALPFGTLLRFRKDIDTPQPPVLLVAPMSGHFATLLRSTVRTLLPEHDVYITDWHNARDICLSEGAFGFDDYIDHLIRFMQIIGPGVHAIAVCQPCVQLLAAVAVMAENNDPAQPRSMTLMAGPVDTRINPTKVNELAQSKPIQWFEQNLLATVPRRFKGAGRKVYPGFIQLSAFLSMNMDRHVKAHKEMYQHLANGDDEKAAVTKAFYDEYFAVLDLPAEFYIETVDRVFQKHELPLGTLEFRGRRVNPAAIKKTSLLTVEGERDDICAVGQTMAAHTLCKSLKPFKKRHHMQPSVGHYGVFSGKRWENQIYPIVKSTILASV